MARSDMLFPVAHPAMGTDVNFLMEAGSAGSSGHAGPASSPGQPRRGRSLQQRTCLSLVSAGSCPTKAVWLGMPRTGPTRTDAAILLFSTRLTMRQRWPEIASTPSVKAAREHYGSAVQYARLDGTLDRAGPVRNDRLGQSRSF